MSEDYTDTERMNVIEILANKKGGILLHNERKTGRVGLGLGVTGRTLRQAVDQIAPFVMHEND